MDSTSQNFGADKRVSIDLRIIVSTHPVPVFNSEMINGFKSIEEEIWRNKLYSPVLEDVSKSNDTVLEQYVDASMRFVSPDFDHKICEMVCESMYIACTPPGSYLNIIG